MESLKNQRWFIFIAFLSLSFFGLLMIYESSSVHAFKSAPGADAAYFFKRQFIFFLIALVFFSFTLILNLDFLQRHSKKILLVTLLSLGLVVILGKEAGGAKRWFSLVGFNIQPSEVLKISFLIYCADYFRRKKNLIKDFKSGLFPLGIVLGTMCALLVLQPDLGGAIFWIIWSFLILFILGADKKHLALIILLGGIISFVLIKASPYRLERIISYLNPFQDPRGSGFQLIQSQIAYGVGGILGVGLGEGIQKLSFLPAPHTDFVFAIIAEEFGLIGSFVLISVFIFLFHKMWKIAKLASNDFRAVILWGVIFIFFLEITINIGVSCGLFPTKGLVLPFMSYGGSSLVVHYVLLGLFFNASRIKKEEQG
jgi:cell division protein FtsW